MAEHAKHHPDLETGSRIIRASGITDASMKAGDTGPDVSLFRSATNLTDTALDVIRPIILGENALIVTSYDNLAAVLAMVMALRPGLTFADRAAMRILLTDQSRPTGRVAQAARMTADRLVSHFLRPGGVHLSDPRDIAAIKAREAIAAGAIRVRIVNPERLVRKGRHSPEGVLANMVVGEDFAAISTAGFSRRDLLDRAVVIDRVASDGSAFAARRDAAETFWSAGMPCNREVSRVLDGLLVPVSVEQAVAAAVEITTGYGSFQARPQIEHPVQSALIGQALARVYENGFAFVSVPAGAGLTEIQDELQRRMANNAARMIGNGAPPQGCWDAHVETATGGNWPEERISSILGSQAPLALDGSIAPIGGETVLTAAHRRMSCRYRMRGTPGSSDFSGFPEIRRDIIELPATKGQLASHTRVVEEIAAAVAGALDDASRKEFARLSRLAIQSPEAAYLAWKQGGMQQRARYGGSTRTPAVAEQNLLPMFADLEFDDADRPDPVAEALSARAFRGIDRSRVQVAVDLAQKHGQILCLVEDDLARHALARRASEICDIPVLGVMSEAALRRDSIATREASYQRAETVDLAISMMAGQTSGPMLVFASALQASQMSLPDCAAALVLSVPEDVAVLASALSCIDGLGKNAGRVHCVTLDDGIPRDTCQGLSVTPATLVAQAARQMRSSVAESRDGVADIMEDLAQRLGSDVEAPTPGQLHVAVIESREPFSIFVLGGSSEEADQAAMPPRLLAICRDPQSGEEVVRRNQVGCAEFLASLAWPPRSDDPRVRPTLPGQEVLSVIGRHMSHLTHWDARPERLVGLLESLARFVTDGEAGGEEVLSDLCLVSLELLGRRWADVLMQSREFSRETDPGLDRAIACLNDRPVWEIDELRTSMVRMIDWRLIEDAGRPKALHERVVAVIHGTGEAELSV